VPVPAVQRLFGNSVYVTVPVTPVEGKPPDKTAWSETGKPRGSGGTLAESRTVARPGVDLATLRAKLGAVDPA